MRLRPSTFGPRGHDYCSHEPPPFNSMGARAAAIKPLTGRRDFATHLVTYLASGSASLLPANKHQRNGPRANRHATPLQGIAGAENSTHSWRDLCLRLAHAGLG
jgi:hypothetical protein